MSDDHRRPSRKLSEEDRKVILERLKRGEFQNRIAADYDVNPGRISEIKNDGSGSEPNLFDLI
ncbi:hypothetical protein [Oceaniglobus trochenteri]|uniref:hypothetical protein n=1 Tax=Oceaniglobus trochenteri TaxID=2763260 RepID=UPI001CFFB0AA|nr:hypothetical protein [Oceaniglobus trochenteri]